MAAAAGFCWLRFLPAAGSSFLAVTFPGLWWAEFHAEKEMGAKLVGLPGSAVLGKKGCMKPAFHCELMRKTHLRQNRGSLLNVAFPMGKGVLQGLCRDRGRGERLDWE